MEGKIKKNKEEKPLRSNDQKRNIDDGEDEMFINNCYASLSLLEKEDETENFSLQKNGRLTGSEIIFLNCSIIFKSNKKHFK